MTAARIIAGDYADLKTVKTRSVVQIVIECPIEEGETVVHMFGFPQPGKPVKVAIARLADANIIEGTTAHKHWDELPLSQQAGIRCNEESFQRFLREDGGSNVNTTDEAATYVRMICGVNTRAALVSNQDAARKWRDLDARFQGWLQGVI